MQILGEIMAPPGVVWMEYTLDRQTREGLRWIILKGSGNRLHEGQITSVVWSKWKWVRDGAEQHYFGGIMVGLRANAIQAQETEKRFTVQKRLTEKMTHIARVVWLRCVASMQLHAR